MTETVLLIRGNNLGQTPGQPTNHHNPSDSDFGMVVTNAMRVGPPEEIYRLVGYQNVPPGTTGFSNGQFWKLETWSGPANPSEVELADPSNWTMIYDGMVPKPDLVAGLGMTPDSVVFEVQGVGRNPSDDYPNEPWGQRHVVLSTKATFPETPGNTIISPPRDENGDIIKGPLEFETIDPIVPCFVFGTMIDTPQGPRAVEDLRKGDLVLTRDHGARPLAWTGSRKLDVVDLMLNPRLQPIRIAAGALGPDMPSEDLLVSPQHRMLVRSRIAERMTGSEEILVAAKDLLTLEGVSVASDVTRVGYVHLMFDQHEVIIANGAATESFFPGPQAMKAIDSAAREEIFVLFPELQGRVDGLDTARTLLGGHKARSLVERHARNEQPLVT